MSAITVAKAAEMTGLTPGQVSNIIFHGPIKPEYHVPEGSGDQAILGQRNVRELQLIARMRKAGVKPYVIKGILQMLSNSTVNKNWWKEDDNYAVILKERWYVTSNPRSSANTRLWANEDFILLVKL